jgi:hypothetical protein
MPLTPWSPWHLWLSAPAEGATPLVGWTHSLVFVVLFCALVDFVKSSPR